MIKPICLFGLLVLLVLLVAGCVDDPVLVEPVIPASTNQLYFVLPEGAELNWALLYIGVAEPSGQSINIHRATSAWEEMTVTWNNFGAAYAPDVYASYTASEAVFYGVDITAMVIEWIEGTYPNHGLLLDQNDAYYPWTLHFAREDTLGSPYIDLCYTMDGEQICELIYPVGDATISEGFPDDNYGSSGFLYTGAPREETAIKRSLIQFAIWGTHESGCSRSIGFWKNHAGFGPQADEVTALLPIHLGTAGGDKSLEVTTAEEARDVLVMKTHGASSNGITKLYAQLLGAKLNFASGADSEDVDDIVEDADTFLADHDWRDWNKLTKAEREDVLHWKDMLDDYNNGLIGPGHCDDHDDDDYDDDH